SEPTGPGRCLTSDSPVWCLTEEASLGLARALYSDRVSLAPGIYLTRGTATATDDPWMDLASRSLDLDLSALTDTTEEGRRRKSRRKYAYIMVALATLAAVLLPFKLKAIALMAATALFIGKLALVVASLVGLKKLVGGKQSEETTHVHYGGHRSDPEAHYLAYQEQIPITDNRFT
ncbi:uncharacterized protein, partial [Halyomorpha halys]|uniref:uncharacterized protein n=1 Tax=Halyomorpha halys TaxID=286706 RepID=UPI0006D4F765